MSMIKKIAVSFLFIFTFFLLTNQVKASCSDSDGGDKPFIAGNTTFSPVPIGSSSPAYDHCTGNELTEYYCNGDSTLGKSVVSCSYYNPIAYCSVNKCIMPTPTLSVTADDTNINLGESFWLSYDVKNADFCYLSTNSDGSAGLSPGPTEIFLSGGSAAQSSRVTPTTVGTKTYTVLSSNIGGVTQKTVSVNVSSGSCTPNTNCSAINLANICTTDNCYDGCSYISGTKDCSTATCAPGYFLYNGACTANPIGFYDEPLTCQAGTLEAVGWAFDGDNVSASINVNFYNGTTTANLLGSATANQPSADVTAYFTNLGQTVTGNHRFDWKKTGMAPGTYTISAYAQNIGVGVNTYLGAKTVTCSSGPVLTASCNSSGLVSASWTAVSGADYYALRIDTDTTLPHLLQEDSLTTTSRTWQGVAGNTYNVWVHSIDNGIWSDYSLKTVTCSTTTIPTCSDGIQNGTETGIDCGGSCPACPIIPTYDCIEPKPAGTVAWDSEEDDDLTRNLNWVYSDTDTSTKCQLKCATGYVRIGSVCVAGPTLSFSVNKITNPEGVESVVNTTNVRDFVIGSSADFTYNVSGTSTYPTTYCEASVSNTNGGNWIGSRPYSNGTYVYPGIQPLAISSYIYRLTCYNSIGAYTSRTISIIVEAPNQPPTAQITGPIRDVETVHYSEPTSKRFEGTGNDTDGSITTYRWFIEDSVDYSEGCTAPNPMLTPTIYTSSRTNSVSLLDDSTYSVCLRVQDDNGAWSAPDYLKITVGTPTPPLQPECIVTDCDLANCGNDAEAICANGATHLEEKECDLVSGTNVDACNYKDKECPCPTTSPSGGGWKEVAP